ncbi:MAG: hypothetical protein FWH33_05550 [Oscillospiraceae bacterium]|nr:hypothetical protein [Oscillospiraceae bacterium]
MSQFTVEDKTRLLELAGKEQDLLERIHGRTLEQAELIVADNVDAFIMSLDSRQELIDSFDGLHQELNVLMQSYLSSVGAGGIKKSQDVDEAWDRLRKLLAECAALNEKNVNAAKSIAEGYIERIGQLSLGRKGLGAYIQDIGNDPEMFDKKT